MLWNENRNRGVTLHQGDTLFELVLNKINDFNRENLAINSSITPIESYDTSFSYHSIKLAGGIILAKKNVPENQTTGIKVYPNPTKGLITIEYPFALWNYFDLSVFNARGQLVGVRRMKNEGTSIMQLDLKEAFGAKSQGLYFLKINNEEWNQTFKILVTE